MDVTFIPNEYAAEGVVIGHPRTVAAIKAEVESRITVERANELVDQAYTGLRQKNERLTASLAALREENQRLERERSEALKCEDCTHDRPALLQENEELRSQLTVLRQRLSEAYRRGLERGELIAISAARAAESIGQLEEHNTASRDRMFARSREAMAIAKTIRAELANSEQPGGGEGE